MRKVTSTKKNLFQQHPTENSPECTHSHSGCKLIQSKSHTVVHPPARCLLPWSYQLDMFHRAVCGWISHTRINSTFYKNALPSVAALSSHQSCTPTHIVLCLVHAIIPNRHWHVHQSVGNCCEILCGSLLYVYTHYNDNVNTMKNNYGITTLFCLFHWVYFYFFQDQQIHITRAKLIS